MTKMLDSAREWAEFNREHASRLSDEVDTLRAEVERLRAALRGLVGAVADHTSQQSIPEALTIARAALAEEKKG